MRERIATIFRNWIAGADTSRWHYDDFSGQMRRLVAGKWETRAPTKEEQDHLEAESAW